MRDSVSHDAALQNALMLARLLGDDLPDQAFALLDVVVDVSYDPTQPEQARLAFEIHAQLSRTLATVELLASEGSGVEVRHGGSMLCCVSMTPDDATISSTSLPRRLCTAPDPISRVISASYVCAFVVAKLVNQPLQISTPDPLIISRSSLPKLDPHERVDIGESWLLGAGAIGCGVLWALRDVPLTGELNVVDPKRVTSGNLNRQILFEDADVGELKALAAVKNAAPLLPGLRLVPHAQPFQGAFGGKSVSRVLVGLDSREVRQEVQRAMPAEVFDASTTGATEVLIHYNELGSSLACLECVYPTREDKMAQARHMAGGLGLTLDEVQAPFITPEVARKLESNFPNLKSADLIGRAISSVYRENCAAEVLRAPGGEQFLAPFAFVSVLAGALMAIHLVSRLQGRLMPYNLWAVRPWNAPFAPAQEMRGQRQGCFCTSPVYARVASRLQRVGAGSHPAELDEGGGEW